MSPYLGFRIDRNFWRELKEAAAEKQTNLSTEVRYRLNKYKDLLEENAFYKEVRESMTAELKTDRNRDDLYPLILEIILLLRTQMMQRDGQLLKKVSDELDRILGPDRPSIYFRG